MYKAGDPWNPHDPASLDFPPTPVEYMRRMQAETARADALFKNPQRLAEVKRVWDEDAAERERTGETLEEQILREKREWAVADAKSRKLKEEGNDAFRKGDYMTAFVIYSVCMVQSGHEPLYPLNRAAVAMKLKLYEMAVGDTTHALENGDYARKTLENGGFNKAKALFRRAQARCFLGEWVKAEEDYTAATKISDDRTITDGFEELKRLRSLPAEDQAAWVSGQEKMTSLDFFKDGEVRRRIEEMLGYTLPD